jgi:uncharacterized protein (DUF433 family)
MNNNLLIDRIIVDPDILTGKPVIKGTRLSVQYILGLMASGADANEILSEYQGLKHEDILACLLFASMTLDSNTFAPLTKKMA